MAAAVGLALALAAAGCSSSDASGGSSPTSADAGRTTTTAASTTTTTEPVAGAEPIGTYAVGRVEVDLVDATRDTPANNDAPATDGRKLKTLALYPAAGEAGPSADPTVTEGAAALDGRFPMLVFSHGVTARASFYDGELAALASAGYVVVAPDYPLSNADSPGGPTVMDVGNQPGDASFLIDTFAEDEGAGTDPSGVVAEVAAHVDTRHIGAIGHSLGAITSLGIGYADCCTDDRVAAVVSWAGLLLPLKGDPNPDPSVTDRPVLLIHGDADDTVPYQSSVDAFDEIASPRWFITLPGQDHVRPYISPGLSAVATLVTTTSIDFFDAELKGEASGLSDLEAAVDAAGPSVATLRTSGG
ncbi:hypothetical protein BH10ACT1_BH10ACT1_28900 [soil metagenome]